MATTISPTQAQKVWVFAQNPDGTLSPATIGGGGGGGVTSVFTRTGAVVAASGDYTVAQVTGAAPLASPTFTGTPAAPTAAGGTNTTQLATTAFVTAAVAAIGGPAFSAITSGTNTTAAMVVGAGGSLNFTSTGTINASTLGGATFAAPGPIGSTTPSTAAHTTLSATGVVTLSQAAASSASAINITGAVFAGNGTTSTPTVYINQAVTQPTTWNTSGTAFGINVATGTGRIVDFHTNGGASVFAVDSSGGMSCAGITSSGGITAAGTSNIGLNGRTQFRSAADGRVAANNNANGAGGLTRFTFGTEAANQPAFSFDGTTATITACDGAGTAANGIFAAALYKSGASSGVSAGPFSTITSIQTTGGIVTTLTSASDERLKDSEAFTDGLSTINSIQPVRYKWNAKGQEHTGISGDKTFVGFLAQNVQAVIPESVTNTEKSKDGSEEYLSFDDRPVVAALVNAVKELAVKVSRLEAK